MCAIFSGWGVTQKTRDGCGCPKLLLEKFSGKEFRSAGKLCTDFPAARNAMVWAFSGKEDGCRKIGPAFGNAPGFSPLRPPQPS